MAPLLDQTARHLPFCSLCSLINQHSVNTTQLSCAQLINPHLLRQTLINSIPTHLRAPQVENPSQSLHKLNSTGTLLVRAKPAGQRITIFTNTAAYWHSCQLDIFQMDDVVGEDEEAWQVLPIFSAPSEMPVPSPPPLFARTYLGNRLKSRRVPGSTSPCSSRLCHWLSGFHPSRQYGSA